MIVVAEGLRLFVGASEAPRDALGAPLVPSDRANYERTVDIVRDALDADVFATAWAEVRAMTVEDVARLALSEWDSKS